MPTAQKRAAQNNGPHKHAADFRSRQVERAWERAVRIEAMRPCGNSNRLQRAAEKLFDVAIEGDVAALREIGDRLDGKARQAIEITRQPPLGEISDDELVSLIAALRKQITPLGVINSTPRTLARPTPVLDGVAVAVAVAVGDSESGTE